MGVLGGPVDLDDTGWGFSAAYTWGPVKVGGTWLRREWETAAAREVRIDTWTVGVDWAVVGPHSVSVQYAQANDSKGNSLTRIGGNGGAEAPRAIVGGTEVGVSDTGARHLSLAYSYAFSKRTRVKLAYIVVDNDSNANIARIGNTAALIPGGGATANGQKVDAYGFHISHSF
jgi:predicted porin